MALDVGTLIRGLPQTNIPGTIVKFTTSYVGGRKAFAAYGNRTTIQRQFNAGVHQGGVILPTLFNICTTKSPTQIHKQTRVQNKNTYNHTYIKFWPRQNNTLTLNPDKTSCSMQSRPCGIYEQSGPQNKHCTTHGNAPKGSGSYLRPKTHIQHTHSQHLSTRTQSSTNNKSTHHNRMG